MTANLTIPADVWSCQQPGVPLVAAIVEGECAHCGPRVGWHHDLDCGGTQLVPPAWLVALRDARCRCVCHVVAPAQGVHCWDRCHDGRLLHAVRVECDGCGGSCGPEQWALARKCCPDCGCGPVRCLVDVAEVRALPTAGACKIKDDHLDVHGTESVLYVLGGYDSELETAHVDALAAACGKPPADWPGGYAVILTTTNQEAE